MSTQNSIIQENILNWDQEAIEKNLNHVISKVAESIKGEDEEIVLEYVVFGLEKVIQHIPMNETEELILKEICIVANDFFQSTIDGIESMNDLAMLSQTQMNRTEACCHLLELCCHILAALLQACQHFLGHQAIQYSYLENYIKTVDSVSKKGANHYVKRKQIYKQNNTGIEEFNKKLTDLQSQYFVLVGTKIDFDKSSNALKDLFGSFSAAAVVALECDVAFMANAWKCFLMFVEKFQNDGIDISDNSAVLTKLCGKIESDFNALSNDGQRNIKELTNSLKVDNFLLKIVVKLCRIFHGAVGNALDDLIRLLLLLFRSSPTYLRSCGKSEEEMNEFTKQLSVGAEPLLSSLYPENEFFLKSSKKIINGQSEINPYGCLIFLMALNKKLTTDADREVYLDILEMSFEIIEKCPLEVIRGKYFAPGSVVNQKKPDLYEYVLITLSNKILSVTRQEFEKMENIFLRNIFQPYVWRAMLACDLWVYVARYCEPSFCNATVDALLKIIEKLDPNTARPEFHHLSILINRLFPLTDNQFMLSISEKYPPAAFTRLWRIIGLKHFKPENQIVAVVDSCVSVIRNWSKNDAPSVALHLQMQDSLILISSIPSQLDITLLKSLWDCIPDAQNKRVLDSYVHSIAVVTAASIGTMPDNDLIEIVKVISNVAMKNLSSSQQYAILSILTKLSGVNVKQNRFLENVVNIFKTILKSDSAIIQKTALSYFCELSYSSTFMEHIGKTVASDQKLKKTFTDFLMKILPKEPKNYSQKCEFKHVCYEIVKNVEDSHPKRIKLDQGVDSEILQQTITRLEQDLSLITNNFALLSSEQKNTVQQFYNNFTMILNKKQ